MNECCQHLFREAKREIEIRDKRIKELQDECTRLFDPTREFWNKERASILVYALVEIENKLQANTSVDDIHEIINLSLQKYRGEA